MWPEYAKNLVCKHNDDSDDQYAEFVIFAVRGEQNAV
jgi:hypothetical protein